MRNEALWNEAATRRAEMGDARFMAAPVAARSGPERAAKLSVDIFSWVFVF